MRHILAALMILGTITTAAQADIYKCPNGQGGTVFQNHPCGSGGHVAIEHKAPAPSAIARQYAIWQQMEAPRTYTFPGAPGAVLDAIIARPLKRGGMHVQGMARNVGTTPLTALRVKIRWTREAQVLEVTEAVLLADVTLAPGEQKMWIVRAGGDSQEATEYDMQVVQTP